jgi:hypothetical protein
MIEQKQLMSTLQTCSMLPHLPYLMMTWYAIDEGLLPCVMGLLCCVSFCPWGICMCALGVILFFSAANGCLQEVNHLIGI